MRRKIMALNLLAVSIVALLAAAPVHGGSRSWESSISYVRVPAFEPPDTLVYDNSTFTDGPPNASNNHKRWVSIKPESGGSGNRPWPNGIVKYCFERRTWPIDDQVKTTKQILFDDLQTARDLWYGAGLPQDKFGWEEMSEADCKDKNKRHEFVLISYNTDGILKTTPGVPPYRASGVGPIMVLSDTIQHGMLDVVSNYAHEMGHAWGLQHEHQNPAFWDLESTTSGAVFTTANWHCNMLSDYQAKMDKIANEESPGAAARQMAAACKNRGPAYLMTFQSAEYLPFEPREIMASSKHKTDIDWDSIMLYPSRAGGVVVNGERQPVLTKPNGEEIPINRTPSPRDVKGLQYLYNYDPDSSFRPFGDIRSRLKNKFKTIRRKDPDSDCN
ncbi:hypothetical protein FQN54_002751 [Arachnomyces sp. PD_36]|nr:hypothetical protein FQN54_002751 [Arachnomyces sp. PD_36]